MDIQDIKQQLSLIETTLKDINGKLMLELLDVMTENRELKEQIAKGNQDDYSEDYNPQFKAVYVTTIEASISHIAEETMVFGIHPETGKRLGEELALYAKRHGDREWDTPEESIHRDFPGVTLQDRRYHAKGCVLVYNLPEPMRINYFEM